MGCSQSSSYPTHRMDKAKSAAIDKQIEDDYKRFKKECKILLLGSGESGKTTIVKQMKIIHQHGFSKTELESFKPIIYRNVLDSAFAVVQFVRRLEICEGEGEGGGVGECRVLADRVFGYRLDPSIPPTLPPELADAITKLWSNPSLQYLLSSPYPHSRPHPHPTSSSSTSTLCTTPPPPGPFYLMDSAPYFFTHINRIASPTYIPTDQDVLRARMKSTGIMETRFTMDQKLSIHMFDVGGQRSERKKWIHCFESVTSIIFCTALSEYDQVLLEERNQNRMLESLVLFESIINSRWFLRTSIILFLNKIDLFKDKLRKIPLSNYFPEYAGGPDPKKASKYILWRFMQVNRADLTVYPHITQATDTGNIRLVFNAVGETILKNALKASGIL